MTSLLSKFLNNDDPTTESSTNEEEAKEHRSESGGGEPTGETTDTDVGGGTVFEGTEEEGRIEQEPASLEDYQLVHLTDDDGNPLDLSPPLLVPKGRFEEYVSQVVREVLIDLHMKEHERRMEARKDTNPKSKRRRGRRTRKHKMRYKPKEESST